ncbi:hypothetical protein O7614_26840 [Micromonospora sp. WMMD961]|uniref:hypothetical protein n=1 Tax=Micromonospora sp. WMMD961 TaxID=3016100 RepID=UPI00241626CA|nr:hypothetical protein [Micromonospora sp. WMMD961]MDG4783281.1 hypothetical protein [Micromonospora sp. WMMD961]
MTEGQVIETEHGAALVLYDQFGDPTNSGWFLRYSNGQQANLDEILSTTDPTDEEGAVDEAKAFLAREGIRVIEPEPKAGELLHTFEWSVESRQPGGPWQSYGFDRGGTVTRDAAKAERAVAALKEQGYQVRMIERETIVRALV